MQSAFKTPALEPITGQPNLHSLLHPIKQICRYSQTTKSKMGPHGYLFVALSKKRYMQFTTVPLNLPGPTPALPNLQGIFDSGQIEQLKINWRAHKTENNNIVNMNEALTTLFLDAIPNAYKKSLNNELVGHTDSEFCPIFQTFLAKYGRITPMDLKLNLQQMKRPWDPNDPIAELFAQLNNAAEYGIFSDNPYSDTTLVNTGDITTLQTWAFAK